MLNKHTHVKNVQFSSDLNADENNYIHLLDGSSHKEGMLPETKVIHTISNWPIWSPGGSLYPRSNSFFSKMPFAIFSVNGYLYDRE